MLLLFFPCSKSGIDSYEHSTKFIFYFQCAKNTCMLKRSSLMIDKTIIDITQVNTFLDKYTNTYPQFEDVMPAIKGRCVGTEMAYVAGCPTVKLVGCLLTMMAYVSYIS